MNMKGILDCNDVDINTHTDSQTDWKIKKYGKGKKSTLTISISNVKSLSILGKTPHYLT